MTFIIVNIPEDLEFYPGYKTWGKKKLSGFEAGIKFSEGEGGHQDGSFNALKPDKMKYKVFFFSPSFWIRYKNRKNSQNQLQLL